MDLDSNGAFTTAWTMLRDLMLNILSWLQNITIGGIPLLYINLGFVLLITFFAILLPALRSRGARELNTRGFEARPSKSSDE